MLEWTGSLYESCHPPVTHSGSHTNEDQILRKLLDDPVVYVDVGAGEPEQCSNTWQFYRRGGRGLLIEPLPEFRCALERHRPGDFVWPTAVGSERGIKPFRLKLSGSSLRADWKIEENGTTEVEVLPLAEILDYFPEIRDYCALCDIDVEGHERDVLLGIDWGRRFRPKVFCIEYVDDDPIKIGPSIEHEWYAILTEHGYIEVARTPYNIIFVARYFEREAKERLNAR